MTREEAIKILEYPVKKWSMEWDEREDGLSYYEALDLAISALRQQEHFRDITKKVGPLTLDELRKMDGEPVWWWNKSAKPVCTICVWDRFMDEPMFANYDWQSEDTLKLSKYKWLKKCGYKPYRQKPEEDKHELVER